MKLLPIVRPCLESFEKMAGNPRTRFCDTCNKHVHDLSAGTEEEARALLAEKRGTRICIRFARDAHGSVRFRMAVVAAALSMTACSSPMVNSPAATPDAPKAAPQSEEILDYDMGDSVMDEIDKCPDAPEGSDPNDGCPEASSPQRSPPTH